MSTTGVSRYTLSMCAAAALATGCSGPQGQVPLSFLDYARHEGTRPAAPTVQQKTWMRATAKSSDLLYVSNPGNNSVTVYAYQSRKLVGTLSGFSNPAGLCADTAGDVWVTDEAASNVIEYAHGGTQPIKTLKDGSKHPLACSVDATTGNLAILNADDVAVYQGASGSPKFYRGGGVYGDDALGYGAHGDLLVDGGSYDNRDLIAFAQLPVGTTRLKQLVLSKTLQWTPPTFVQWDGQFWVVGTETLDWFKIAGNRGIFEGYSMISPSSPIAQFWIASVGAGSERGNQIVVTEDDPYKVEFFQYPAGGQPFASIIDGLSDPYGIAVSKASR
jgi:hypothetical protein